MYTTLISSTIAIAVSITVSSTIAKAVILTELGHEDGLLSQQAVPLVSEPGILRHERGLHLQRSAAACTTLRPRMRQSDVNMSSPLSALPRASAAGRARAPGRRRPRSRCPPSPPGRGEHDGRRASRPRQRARARRRAPPPPPLDTAMDSASAAGFKTSVASSSLENLLRRPRRASRAYVRDGGRRALAQTTA